MKPFKILSRETLVDHQFYNLEKQVVGLPNGETGEWFVKHNNDAVVIIPMTSDGSVLLQKNYKHGCGEIIIESCAGLIDDGETWEDAAPRELSEETGYEAEKYIKLGESFANPTSCDMKYHFILATNIKKVGEAHQEPEEQIEPFLVESLEKADEILRNGDFLTSAGILAALHAVKAHLKI